ncbi:tumor protein p53-inducible protein 13 isoform X1 [Megalobrama amblycephala]|uniref:tumor protein p53-inducible protein 13 isoform X1 n=2 Tax=Megalobrama amblycephala TaxID=75352 RepID=UPI002013EF18|nr:tumor protein p53-inducible protein 13 isoform X1 [Megalobrama amblycephala]
MSRRLILLSGFICLCVTRCCPSRLTHCDTGKTNLFTDLPGPEELVCQEHWPQSQTNIPDTDTKHIIKAADSICMDTPITYNDRIPTHGPYRPVEAESGEYLYCPPQRWLNNLKNGALVFLYHPCVSAEAHRSLAVLAHSCLPRYILTPHPWLSQHRPLAVVSWGRSLEMSHITLRVCDWLLFISSNISQASTNQRAKYNLFLTKPAPVHKPVNTSQEMSKVERLKSLKRCCMEALSLTEVQRTRRRTRKIRNVLKQSPEEVEPKYDVKPDELNSTKSAKLNRTDTLPQNNTKEMASFSMLTVTQSLSSAKDSEKSGDKDKIIDAEKLFPQKKVTERHKYQIDRKTHKKTIVEGERHRVKTDTKAQRSGSECGELGQCGVSDSMSPNLGGPLRGERIPIPRTDEAVWAAGALGFLLVLLTLSVLHTRLYRHCRSSTSLYWHDHQQDYENVGDIIRRRLRMVGRRKRRSSQSRRQECALLYSSNEENSD